MHSESGGGGGICPPEGFKSRVEVKHTTAAKIKTRFKF